MNAADINLSTPRVHDDGRPASAPKGMRWHFSALSGWRLDVSSEAAVVGRGHAEATSTKSRPVSSAGVQIPTSLSSRGLFDREPIGTPARDSQNRDRNG